MWNTTESVTPLRVKRQHMSFILNMVAQEDRKAGVENDITRQSEALAEQGSGRRLFER
jgi:hypothetical protein